MKQNGFTLLELAISGALFALLFGGVAAVMVEDTITERTVAAQVGPELKARHALDQIVRELRNTGVRGEDRNADGQLDPNEDVDADYAFDSDWNLLDGVMDLANVSFSLRLGSKDTAEDLVAGTLFSQGISYRLELDRLVRLVRRVDPASGATVSRTEVVAEGVHGLRFSRNGFLITVSLDVALPNGAYRQTYRTLTETVLIRN